MEKLECPDCSKMEMFKNQAGGLTCGNKACGRVILNCSAEQARKMLCLINAAESIIKSNEVIVEKYEQLVKRMNEKMALMEAQLKQIKR